MSKKRSGNLRYGTAPKPRLRFSPKLVLSIWIFVLAGFFAAYMVLANFTDAFIRGEDKILKTTERIVGEQQTETEAVVSDGYGFVNPVPKNVDKAGSSYFSRCLFVGDSILNGLLGVCSLDSEDVKTGSSYILSNISSSELTVSEDYLYLCLGYAESGEKTNDELISHYNDVLRTLRNSSPTTTIYVMALPPVAKESTITTNATIDDFNSKLLALATELSIHYIDTNTLLKDNAGNLAEEYYEDDDGVRRMNDAAYLEVADYILFHTVE